MGSAKLTVSRLFLEMAFEHFDQAVCKTTKALLELSAVLNKIPVTPEELVELEIEDLRPLTAKEVVEEELGNG